MNYEKIYDKIIDRAKIENRKRNDRREYDNHHILPKSLGGSDDDSNLVLLTLKEHLVAHVLLCKIYNCDYEKASKMYSAVRRMMSSGRHKVRYSCRIYEMMRRGFINNHPVKSERVKTKIISSLRESRLVSGYTISMCGCGCGQEAGLNAPGFSAVKYVDGHKKFNECACGCGLTVKNGRWTDVCKNKKIKCACGCGENTYKRYDSAQLEDKIFVIGHDPSSAAKISKSIEKYCSGLSQDEMNERMKKSALSCDQKQRALSIRKGKSSEFMLETQNGEKTTFFSYDDVLSLTGYSYSQIKNRIDRYNGVLKNGNKVICVRRYSGNDKNVERKRNNSVAAGQSG